jgi:DNA-binding NarL/FixJ family response regulator
MAIRIIIGDDDPLIREALGIIFGKDRDFELVASVRDGEQAVEACLASAVDVALLDIRMPRMSGIDAAAKITSGSACKVLLLSTFNEERLARGALSSGASGYLLKGCGGDEIKEAIRLVRSGHTVFKDEVFASIRTNPSGAAADLSSLSGRERDIVKLVADGYSNKEAAQALGLSEGTVKNHVSAILDKLGLRQRTQIAVYFVSGRKTFD